MPAHRIRPLVASLLVALAAGLLTGPASAQGRGRPAPGARKRPASPSVPAVAPAPAVEEEADEPPSAVPAPVPPAPPSAQAPAGVPAAQEEQARETRREAAREARRESIERLRARHDELRDAVFRSRARRETLEQALLSTRLQLALRWRANRNYTLARAELRLDGTRIWDSGDRPVGEDTVVLAPRSVPPGPHVLTLRIEVRSRDSPKLGYTSEQSYTLVLAEGKRTSVEVSVDEDGSLPSYNPDVEIDVDVD